MDLASFAWSALQYFWSLFTTWIFIFLAPFQNPNMFWIIIPIYLSWIFTDFFQERKGTSLGNAVSNGVVVFWVSIDWARTIIGSLDQFSWSIVFKFLLVIFSFIYGLLIIIEGIKGRDFVVLIGRAREVAYVMIMFTPVIYDVFNLSLSYLLAVLLFFPLFYFSMEYVDSHLLPKFGIVKFEEKEKEMEDEIEKKK
jgi:hypothetical protein